VVVVGIALVLGAGVGVAAVHDSSRAGGMSDAAAVMGRAAATVPSESDGTDLPLSTADQGADGAEGSGDGTAPADRSAADGSDADAVLRDGSAEDAVATPPEPDPPVDPDAVDAAGLTQADRDAGLVSTDVPATATGTVVVAPGVSAAPAPERRVVTVRVEVEAGLPVDPAPFAHTVMSILNDPRGWGFDGSVSFAQTDGPADIRVVLASPVLTDRLCVPLRTGGRYSCGRNGAAVLNHTRWVQATPEFADRSLYRTYLVNHEVGHLLGKPHVPCPGEGVTAPVMQQQSIEVAPCVANGWPALAGAG
jgi:hypothetical protein